MPELPEVETVRLGLIPAVEGHRLTRVQARRADLRIAFPSGFVERLTGRNVSRIRRRAKYLLLDLDSGETLIMHLGMSGRLTIHRAKAAVTPGRFHHKAAEDGSGEGKHDHVVFETEEGTRIVFTDHRRFGLMALTETSGLENDKLFYFIAADLQRGESTKQTDPTRIEPRVVSYFNSIGLPAEGFGFSNNPPTFLGMPNFDGVRISVPRSGVRTVVTS